MGGLSRIRKVSHEPDERNRILEGQGAEPAHMSQGLVGVVSDWPVVVGRWGA